jgi:hypothetical protein
MNRNTKMTQQSKTKGESDRVKDEDLEKNSLKKKRLSESER